jgi:hypothetical protein
MNTRIPIGAPHTTWAARIADTARRILREAVAEIARLNRAGLDDHTLAGKSRHDRARTVAAALAHRHDGPTRCC